MFRCWLFKLHGSIVGGNVALQVETLAVTFCVTLAFFPMYAQIISKYFLNLK